MGFRCFLQPMNDCPELREGRVVNHHVGFVHDFHYLRSVERTSLGKPAVSCSLPIIVEPPCPFSVIKASGSQVSEPEDVEEIDQEDYDLEFAVV